jgi:hypothetical protein
MFSGLTQMQARNKISLLVPKQFLEDILKQWSDLFLVKIHHMHNKKNSTESIYHISWKTTQVIKVIFGIVLTLILG